MIKALLLAWGLQGAAAAVTTRPLDTSVRRRVANIVETMQLPGVDVSVEWMPCGEMNGMYINAAHTIFMCDEDEADPDVAVFIAAHEMGHAIIEQREIPVTGSEEAAADELGVLGCVAGDELTAVDAAGLWLAEMKGKDDPADPHPGHAKRAYTLICLADGAESEPDDLTCQSKLNHVAYTWRRLLSVDWKDGE